METSLQAFDQLKADITIEMSHCMELKIADKNSLDLATLEGKKVKHFAKLVEAKRKELVKPLNERVDSINSYAKGILAPVLEAESHIKSEMAKYALVLEKERKAAAAKLEEEQKKKQADLQDKQKKEAAAIEMAAAFGVDDDPTIKRQQIISKASNEREQSEIDKQGKIESAAIESNKVSGEQKRWTFDVTKLEDVPRNFLVVDEKAVRAAINSGAREIPGLHIYQKTIIALR